MDVFHTNYNMNFSIPFGLTFKKRMIDDTSKVLNGVSICFRINVDYWPVIGDNIQIFHFYAEKKRELFFLLMYGFPSFIVMYVNFLMGDIIGTPHPIRILFVFQLFQPQESSYWI